MSGKSVLTLFSLLDFFILLIKIYSEFSGCVSPLIWALFWEPHQQDCTSRRKGVDLGFIKSVDVAVYFNSHRPTNQLTCFLQATGRKTNSSVHIL